MTFFASVVGKPHLAKPGKKKGLTAGTLRQKEKKEKGRSYFAEKSVGAFWNPAPVLCPLVEKKEKEKGGGRGSSSPASPERESFRLFLIGKSEKGKQE